METARGKHRVRVENEMIRKREKEFQHEQTWGGATKYYEHFNNVNAKFEDWTSPRYYDESMKQYSEMKTKRDKEDLLEKRRERMRKLYEVEESAYEVEMMVKKNKISDVKKCDLDKVSSDVLKDINHTFKEAEELKRKQEAETKLYQHWRLNNPVVRNCERAYNNRNMKLSWLDQQIEKRMKREKEEEEAKRILREREEMMRKQKEREEEIKREVREKEILYKELLDEQVKGLKIRNQMAENLKLEEQKEVRQKVKIVEIEEKQVQEERRRLERECALFNIRQYQMKLKQKAKDIQENLTMENELIMKLQQLELNRIIEDAKKRKELQEMFDRYLKLVKVHQGLENDRQKKLDLIFDSEAKCIFERQAELWKNEELARKGLLKEVMDTIKTQIEVNIEKNKEKQMQVLKEREETTEKIELYHKELELVTRERERKQLSRRQDLQEDIKVKNAKKVQQGNIKLRELDDELNRIQKEEERLKKEIMNMQKKFGTYRPTNHKFY